MNSLCLLPIHARKITISLYVTLTLLFTITLLCHVKCALLRNPILIPIIMFVILAQKMLPSMILKHTPANSVQKDKPTTKNRADVKQINKNSSQ